MTIPSQTIDLPALQGLSIGLGDLWVCIDATAFPIVSSPEGLAVVSAAASVGYLAGVPGTIHRELIHRHDSADAEAVRLKVYLTTSRADLAGRLMSMEDGAAVDGVHGMKTALARVLEIRADHHERHCRYDSDPRVVVRVARPDSAFASAGGAFDDAFHPVFAEPDGTYDIGLVRIALVVACQRGCTVTQQ